MSIPSKPKLHVVSENGFGAIHAASEHFSGSHGMDHGSAWIGVVYPATHDAMDALAAIPGVHVSSERDPDPIDAKLLKHVAHVAGITANETGFSLARKLHRHYQATYFRPEF